eukprot:scaffold126209_cov42-Tisochrysis_lutea.AAC.1
MHGPTFCHASMMTQARRGRPATYTDHGIVFMKSSRLTTPSSSKSASLSMSLAIRAETGWPRDANAVWSESTVIIPSDEAKVLKIFRVSSSMDTSGRGRVNTETNSSNPSFRTIGATSVTTSMT